MKPSTLVATALGAALLTASLLVGVAEAQPIRRLADDDVRELTSTRQGRDVYRAILTGRRGQSQLYLERVGFRRVERQENLDRYRGFRPRRRGRRTRSFPPGTRFERLRFRGSELHFVAERRGRRFACEVQLNRRRWIPRCRRSGAVTAPPPAPVPPPAAGPVARACRVHFNGNRNEARCERIASRAPYPAAGIVQMCARTMDGDPNELKCLRQAVRYHADPSQVLGACQRAFDGDPNELDCMQALTDTPLRRADRIIRGCTRRHAGDRAELACIRRRAGNGQGGFWNQWPRSR